MLPPTLFDFVLVIFVLVLVLFARLGPSLQFGSLQPQMFVAATWPLQTWTLPLRDVDQLQPVASLE